MSQVQSKLVTRRLEQIKHIGKNRSQELSAYFASEERAIQAIAEADVEMLRSRFSLSSYEAKQMKGTAQGVARQMGIR